MSIIPLADLARMPTGVTQVYILDPGDHHYFVKKLSTYCKRSGAKIDYDIYRCISDRSDAVIRMAICKVVVQGKKRKRNRSNNNADQHSTRKLASRGIGAKNRKGDSRPAARQHG